MCVDGCLIWAQIGHTKTLGRFQEALPRSPSAARASSRVEEAKALPPPPGPTPPVLGKRAEAR